MSYYKYPQPKVRHEGFVLSYNDIKSSGIIRTNNGNEYRFYRSAVLCRNIQAGDRVQFIEGIDTGHIIAKSINKY
jgi:hypothetical protein